MMDHFGRTDIGKAIIDAIKAVIDEKKYVPYDMGGNAVNGRSRKGSLR